MKLTHVGALVCLLVAGTSLEAAAQQQQPQDIVGRRIQGDRGSTRPYFQPHDAPYQGSFSRRWRQQLEESWGGIPANRGVPRHDYRFGLPRPGPDLIFVHPPGRYYYDCRGPACHRVWHRDGQRWGAGWGWHGWQPPTR